MSTIRILHLHLGKNKTNKYTRIKFGEVNKLFTYLWISSIENLLLMFTLIETKYMVFSAYDLHSASHPYQNIKGKKILVYVQRISRGERQEVRDWSLLIYYMESACTCYTLIAKHLFLEKYWGVTAMANEINLTSFCLLSSFSFSEFHKRKFKPSFCQ